MLEEESQGTEQLNFGDSTSSFGVVDLRYHLNKQRRHQSVSPKANTSEEWMERRLRTRVGTLHSAYSSLSTVTATSTSTTPSTLKDSQLTIGAANTNCSWTCRPPPLYSVEGDMKESELDPTVRTSHSTLTSRITSTPATSTNNMYPAHDKSTSSGGNCLMTTLVMWKRQQRDEERRLKKEQSHKHLLSSSDSKISYSHGSLPAPTVGHLNKSASVLATTDGKNRASSSIDVDCYFVQAFLRNLSRKQQQQQQQQQAPESLIR
jgi:hypothetical protein